MNDHTTLFMVLWTLLVFGVGGCVGYAFRATFNKARLIIGRGAQEHVKCYAQGLNVYVQRKRSDRR